MTTFGLLRRALRSGRRWWWGSARPSTGASLAGSGVARPAHETGRAPTPQERWQPVTTATGPWRAVDPMVAPAWRGRGAHLAVAAWGLVTALQVRRALRGDA